MTVSSVRMAQVWEPLALSSLNFWLGLPPKLPAEKRATLTSRTFSRRRGGVAELPLLPSPVNCWPATAPPEPAAVGARVEAANPAVAPAPTHIAATTNTTTARPRPRANHKPNRRASLKNMPNHSNSAGLSLYGRLTGPLALMMGCPATGLAVHVCVLGGLRPLGVLRLDDVNAVGRICGEPVIACGGGGPHVGSRGFSDRRSAEGQRARAM
jgi:hypothetical protein